MAEWGRLAVCSDCLYTAANGAPDWDGYGESGHAQRYAQATERHGVELVAACPEPDHGNPDTGESCHRYSFSWHPCDWCGDTLGGSRYCAAVES